MNNYKLLIAYQGTHYCGFQKTKMGPSIEETLQTALQRILQAPVELQAASRTDQGVHAEEQVCNFFAKDPDLYTLYGSLRSLLPKDIAPLQVKQAPTTFHPTLDAKGKEYHYYICNLPTQIPFHTAFSWHVPLPLNLELMQEAIPFLIGKRDFSAFSNARYDDPVRTLVSLDIDQMPEQRLRIRVTGDHFLYKMVRNLIGTLVHVGQEKISIQDLPHILASSDRRLAGMTAPAQGLFLHRVFY